MLCSVLLYLCVCLKIDCSDQKLDLFADPAFLLAQLPNIHRKLNFYFWENWTHSQTSIGKLIRKIDFLISPGRVERADLKGFIFCEISSPLLSMLEIWYEGAWVTWSRAAPVLLSYLPQFLSWFLLSPSWSSAVSQPPSPSITWQGPPLLWPTPTSTLSLSLIQLIFTWLISGSKF